MIFNEHLAFWRHANFYDITYFILDVDPVEFCCPLGLWKMGTASKARQLQYISLFKMRLVYRHWGLDAECDV